MQVFLAYYHGDLVGIDVCEILQTCAGSAVLSVLQGEGSFQRWLGLRARNFQPMLFIDHCVQSTDALSDPMNDSKCGPLLLHARGAFEDYFRHGHTFESPGLAKMIFIIQTLGPKASLSGILSW